MLEIAVDNLGGLCKTTFGIHTCGLDSHERLLEMTKEQIALLSPVVRQRTEGEHRVAFMAFRILSGLGFEDQLPVPRDEFRVVLSYDTWDDDQCYDLNSIADVREHLHACDEEWMCVVHGEEIVFCVSFVWGNSPSECIADWTGSQPWFDLYDKQFDDLLEEASEGRYDYETV